MNNTNPILQSKDLHVGFGGVKAADGVDLALWPGQLASIIGPNGSGKTTFLNLCTGYIRALSGSVRFDGHELTALKPRTITRLGIARTFQLPQLFSEHTVLENVLIAIAARRRFWTMSRLANREALEEAHHFLSMFGLDQQAHRVIGAIPEGVRKLVDIAVAMALKPKLLLMDEPTSGVSTIEKFAIMDTLVPILRQQQVTALLVEHDMELVERYMDRVIVWSAGKVVGDGPPAEVLQSEEVKRNVVGVE